jgi:prolycopene isomerase
MHLIADTGPPTNKGGVREFLEDELGIHLDWVEIPEAFRLIVTDEGEELDVTLRYGVQDYIDLCMEVVDALTYLGESRGNPDRKVLTSKYGNFLKTAP